jgi:hypothetical protein
MNLGASLMQQTGKVGRGCTSTQNSDGSFCKLFDLCVL